MIKYCLLALSLCYLITSCNKTGNTVGVKEGLIYYPLQIGKYKIYKIDSVTFRQLANSQIQKDTYSFQLRETYIDTFTDNAKILNYIILREKRTSDTALWQIANVASTALTAETALRTDNNLTFIKMPLAFIDKTAWNGDAFIDSTVNIEIAGGTLELISKKRWNWNYDVENFDQPTQIDKTIFPNVLTILSQIDPTILTEKRYTLEKYAKNVGLIYKEQSILDSQNLNSALSWTQRAQKGFILTQRIVSYN